MYQQLPAAFPACSGEAAVGRCVEQLLEAYMSAASHDITLEATIVAQHGTKFCSYSDMMTFMFSNVVLVRTATPLQPSANGYYAKPLNGKYVQGEVRKLKEALTQQKTVLAQQQGKFYSSR